MTNFEIVLASGKLVSANSSSRPDLFRALKGGTNNFGLVTRIDFTTVDIPHQILGGGLVNDISDRNAIFTAFANIAAAEHYDQHASLVVGLIFNSTSKEWVLSSTPAYTLPDLRPKVYEELFAVPNISDTLHLTQLHVLANESATPPLNWLFETGTYGVSAHLLESMFDIVNTTVYNFDVPEGVLWDIAFEPLPTVFTAVGAGKNSLGTSPSDGNQIVMLISALWPGSDSNERVHAKAKQVLGRIDREAEGMGVKKRFVYANYADWSQQPLESYGEKNVEFLEKVARKYDAKGVFQTKAPGGFKLPVRHGRG